MPRRTTIPVLLIASALVCLPRLSAQCPREADNGETTIELTHHLSSDSPAEPKITIQSIKFEGQTGLTLLEQAEIVEAVADKVGNYDPNWVEEFQERLGDAWQQRGYFKAEIKAMSHLVSET